MANGFTEGTEVLTMVMHGGSSVATGVDFSQQWVPPRGPLLCLAHAEIAAICVVSVGFTAATRPLSSVLLKATSVSTNYPWLQLVTHQQHILAMSSPQCFENPPNLNSDIHGAGTVQELGGLNSYVTGSSDSKLALILVSDVFGYEAPKLRKLADKVAAAGFLVVVPDLLYGDYIVDLNNPQFDRESWRKAHGKDKACEDTKPLISALKSKGVKSIGAAGFCWGGVVVVKLAMSTDIQAAVILHPGLIADNEFNEVRIPIAILGAEIDHLFPPERLKQIEEMLSVKAEFESFVKLYPGVSHGWTLRYNDDDEATVKSAKEAHQDMLNWFIKHVK
ncbi:hypothetical protein JHK82_036863 [Glycine max]|nr:hypothetical protein JHK86_037069 [Glycine max]KAG5113594.1 hypothetical protein JHK82_036863 [Glycine max]KAG5130871.1 hypothetical protein JHK84_037268 [Glycine max]